MIGPLATAVSGEISPGAEVLSIRSRLDICAAQAAPCYVPARHAGHADIILELIDGAAATMMGTSRPIMDRTRVG